MGRIARIVSALVVLCAALCAQPQQIRMEPVHDAGQSVTPAFEGWFQNPDGTYSILFGYFNRNAKEELDIPIGPNNRLEPGGPDNGQPTHFATRRQWGAFTATVPKDFGTQKLIWTLIANGVTTSIPASLDPLWELSPLHDATGNTPPFIGFSATGPFTQGPRGQSQSMQTAVGKPLELTAWLADDANVVPGATRPRTPAATASWSKFRGTGDMTFSNATPPPRESEFAAPPKTTFHAKAITTATFSEPGEYILRIVSNDYSGEGGRGFQCCWSNAQVKVVVTSK